MPLRKLLLIDADDAGRRFLETCTSWKLVVGSGADGVQLAERNQPDVILLDATLAGSGETSVPAQLRGNKNTARIPVILLVGADESDGGDRSRSLGIAGVIQKPLEATTLVPLVQEIFAEARLTVQLARLEELGGDTFVREMIDIFLQTTPERLSAARAGLEMNNLDAVERAVHSLKSSAGNMGADAMQALATEAEEVAEERHVDLLPALLDQLDHAFAGIKARLGREMKNEERRTENRE